MKLTSNSYTIFFFPPSVASPQTSSHLLCYKTVFTTSLEYETGRKFSAQALPPSTLCVSFQVIAPEEIIDPSVDEQSVMTYLSQFPKAKLKPGAPLKPKLNPKKARAYGPGESLTNISHLSYSCLHFTLSTRCLHIF